MSLIKKGAKSSINGKNYELEIYNILKKCKFNGQIFNTQTINELGGSTLNNDIICNYKKYYYNLRYSINNNLIFIPIEIKKNTSPDWMQCTLKYDFIDKKWKGSEKNKIPNKSKILYEELIDDIKLFNNKIPPFLLKNITHTEWIDIKNNTNDFNDVYINCPNDIIKQLYSNKGCKYIQISNKGLYYLENDICNFKVPEFICPQRLRIRTKIHTRKNKNGYCKLSVMISCQPKSIANLINSKYSLDDYLKLPNNLIYNYK